MRNAHTSIDTYTYVRACLAEGVAINRFHALHRVYSRGDILSRKSISRIRRIFRKIHARKDDRSHFFFFFYLARWDSTAGSPSSGSKVRNWDNGLFREHRKKKKKKREKEEKRRRTSEEEASRDCERGGWKFIACIRKKVVRPAQRLHILLSPPPPPPFYGCTCVPTYICTPV